MNEVIPAPPPPTAALTTSVQLWPWMPRDVEQRGILCPHVLEDLCWLPGMPPHFLMHVPLPGWPRAYILTGLVGASPPTIGQVLSATEQGMEYLRLSRVLRELVDLYLRPVVLRVMSRLCTLSAVCRHWAHGVAPWFSVLYARYAALAQLSHRGLYLKRAALPPELCRRYLILGLYQPSSRLDRIIQLDQPSGAAIADWDAATRTMAEYPCLLTRKWTNGHGHNVRRGPRRTLFDLVLLANEADAVEHARGLPPGSGEGYSLCRVVHFDGEERVPPPLAGNREGWLRVVRQRIEQRRALSDWHHAYARETTAIIEAAPHRAKRAHWYNALRRHAAQERKRRRDEDASSSSSDSAPPAKRRRGAD